MTCGHDDSTINIVTGIIIIIIIIIMALSRVISEIFNVEIYRDLEIWAKGQSRSLKVVHFDRLSMVKHTQFDI